MENSSLNHTENHKTEEKETKRTPIKQRKKENEVLRFIPGAYPVLCGGSAGGRFSHCACHVCEAEGIRL